MSCRSRWWEWRGAEILGIVDRLTSPNFEGLVRSVALRPTRCRSTAQRHRAVVYTTWRGRAW